MRFIARGVTALLTLVHLLVALPVSLGAAERTDANGKFIKADWRLQQGKWSFSSEGELRCEGSGYSSLITRRGLSAQDLDISVEVMFTSEESSVGLVIRSGQERRYRDKTFYQFEWYTAGRHHGKRLSLMRKNPRWKQIVRPIFREAPLNRWISFRVKASGELIECFIDGEKVFSRRDRALLRKGAAGLHVFQPRAVRFRNIQISGR